MCAQHKLCVAIIVSHAPAASLAGIFILFVRRPAYIFRGHNEQFFKQEDKRIMITPDLIEGLTFDDVLLLPAHSDVLPNETDTATQFTR